MSGRSVAAIVPAHDEETRVADTVRSLVASGRIDEIVVVDDGSRDATAERARQAGARVLRFSRNRGKGAALRAGLSATDAGIVLLCDADLGATASGVTALLDPVLAGDADVAVAAPPRGRGPSGFGIVERFARWTIRRGTGRTMWRPLSGQRAIRRDALPRVIAPGYGAEVAMTIDVLRSGGRVVEVPCDFEHARTGRTVAGFLHRGRQALDIVRAYAPRARPAPTTGKGPRS
jgi:glycosyltransferase involved in cell wall biosynthesis